jgi:hypothetical protein
MMPAVSRVEVPIEERAAQRLRSAVQLLYLLALLKLFATLLAPRAMKGADAAPVIAWFGAGLIVSLLLGWALGRPRVWARNVAIAWGGFHIAGIFFVLRIGIVAILEGLLGVMIVVSLLVATGLGAFDET